MKHFFKRKAMVTSLCILLGFCSALGVSAAEYGYATYETVEKTGSGTVYSGSTGTNTFHIKYGATCTSGVLEYNPQVLGDNLTYCDMFGLGGTLQAGETSGDRRASDLAPFKVFRMKLSGFSGRGTGFIQGLE